MTCGFVSTVCVDVLCFFFKQKTAYEMRISDWSSDVCSSDLEVSHLPEIDPEKLRPRMLPHNPKDLKSPMGATVKHGIRREEGLAAASLHEQVPQRRRQDRTSVL